MKIKWRKLILRLLLWLSLEILLTFLNLDDIADYSEFIDKKTKIVLVS